MASALGKRGEVLVLGAKAGVVSAKGAQHVLERHFLLSGVGLATVERTERLRFGLDVMWPCQRVRLRDAFGDLVFEQLRGCHVFLGGGKLPCSGTFGFCDLGLFLGRGLGCIGSDDLLRFAQRPDVLGLHTDALER